MKSDRSLRCHSCSRQYSVETKRWNCECGGYFDLDFSPHFARENILSRKPTMWRYREAIPIGTPDDIISLDEGFTPLSDLVLNDLRIKVKFEHLNPTGSFKDRGASVLISRMIELGIKNIIEDSSGNAGSAIAAYATKAGIESHIYVPDRIPENKIRRIASRGGRIMKIAGTREETAAAAIQAVMKKQNSSTYGSHVWNPFFLHGTKTFAYELVEQLQWTIPDTVILPVGNGTLLLGCYIGFKELLDADITERMPVIIGVQSRNCNPLVRSFRREMNLMDPDKGIEDAERTMMSQNADEKPQSTIAEGIQVASPVRGDQIVEAVRETRGSIIDVGEDDIKGIHRDVIAKGIIIESTAAVGIAGVLEYRKQRNIDDDEVIVTAFTGHGFHGSNHWITPIH